MPWFKFDPQSFSLSFLSLLFESVPFLLLGSLAAGLIEVFVPARWMTRLLPRNPAAAILASGLLGLVFPMCECGVVPVIRRLMKKGLPASCAVTYLLASPVVNPIVAVSTTVAFRGNQPGLMVSFRLLLSFCIAALVGLIAQRLKPEDYLHPKVVETLPGRARRAGFRLGSLAAGSGGGFAAAAPFSLEGTEGGSGGDTALAALDALENDLQPSFLRRLLTAMQRGTNDFLDVAVYVVIGTALASVFNTAVNQQAVLYPLAQNPVTAVGSMMLFGFFLAICSTSDAFIAASFTAFPFASKLAFLVFGPVFDLKLIFLYSLVFRRRFVVALGIGLFLLIGLICLRFSSWQF